MRTIEFLEPWMADGNPALAQELYRELSPGHVLYRQTVMPLARRQDRDDVLYRLADGSDRVAQVHLTYCRERDPAFPATKMFADLAAWEGTMQTDHAEFTT